MGAMSTQSTKKRPDHVPGPIEAAAAKVYFNRGSKEAIDKNRWRTVAVGSLFVAALGVTSTVVLALTSKVHVMQVSQVDGGRLEVVGVASRFSANDEIKMAWANDFVNELTEILPAVWQRNAQKVQARSVGVAVDQTRSYLVNNNPAQILAKHPSFVREYRRRSVNKIADNTFLVRYELTDRSHQGATPQVRRFAMTITLTSVGHRTIDDVYANPSGLAAVSFSISEEN